MLTKDDSYIQKDSSPIDVNRNYTKEKAALKLMCELQKGRLSGEENGRLSEEDIEKYFALENMLRGT